MHRLRSCLIDPGDYVMVGPDGCVDGRLTRLPSREYILAGAWGPSDPTKHLRNQCAAAALMYGCERAGIDLDDVEPGADEPHSTLLVIADAKGMRRMTGYDPSSPIAANE